MAIITETGTIDLAAQKEAHDEASQVATNYITPNGTSTASFHPQASSTNQVKVDSNGVDIIKSGTSVAMYGEGARIGKQSESRIELDYHAMKLIDKDGTTYLHISDLRNSDGVASISEQFVVDSNTEKTSNSTIFTLAYVANSVTRVIVDDSEIESNNYNVTTESPSSLVSTLTINMVLNIGQEVSVEYTTTSNLAKAFTFGYRKPGSFTGAESHAVGSYIEASGRLSNAEGLWTVASGFNSRAEGNNTKAKGETSHAEGYLTEANGRNSHAEGNGTKANKAGSHSEGYGTTASGSYSHVEGHETESYGSYSHAEGYGTEAYGNYSHAEGVGTEAHGTGSNAEGNGTVAYGDFSHAEGKGTDAHGDYSHAEGNYASASGNYSHAEGNNTEASGNNSHAEGDNTEASKYASHAEGSSTEASGNNSHAEGHSVVASGENSHAQNYGTIASGNSQTAIGKWNIDDSSGDLAFIIGNGVSSISRSNAFTVDWDGNIYPTKKVVLTSPANRDNPSGTAVYDNDRSLYIVDADGERIGMIRTEQSTGGNITLTLMSIGEKTDGTEVINQISLNSLRDGTRTYYVANPAGFRSAISAFSTDGGTVTGLVAAKNTVIDRAVNPSSAQYSTNVGGGSSFILTDKNGATLGYVRASKQTDGRTGLDLRAFNSQTNGSSVVSGGIQILIDRSGAVTYSIYNQANFRNAIGASSGIFPRSVGGTGMSARTTGTVTRSGLDTTGTIAAYSNGVVCTVSANNVHLKTALANNGSVTLATLPTGYRPPMSVYGNLCSDSATNGKGYVGITSSGEIKFHNFKGSNWTTSDDIRFTITWAL